MLLLRAFTPLPTSSEAVMTEITRAERAELENMVRHLDDDGVRLVHEAVDWVMTHPGKELPPKMLAEADAIAAKAKAAA